MRRRVFATGLALALLAALMARLEAQDAYVKSIEDWRHTHETEYTRDYVPLAGLFTLSLGSNTVGSDPYSIVLLPDRLPGRAGTILMQRDHRLFFQPSYAGSATLKGRPITGPIPLKSDIKEDPDEIVVVPGGAGAAKSGSTTPVAFWVHESGARRMVRLRDPDSEQARTFKGFIWFTIDRKYMVPGRFIKDPEPRTMLVPNFFGDEDEYKTEGVVEFTLAGKTARIRPFTLDDGRLFYVFKDETSGHETYEAARFLYSELKPDGTTTLDFNKAYNPPCSFNPFTTCPIPLPENKLNLRILAGEKAYPNPPKPPV